MAASFGVAQLIAGCRGSCAFHTWILLVFGFRCSLVLCSANWNVCYLFLACSYLGYVGNTGARAYALALLQYAVPAGWLHMASPTFTLAPCMQVCTLLNIFLHYVLWSQRIPGFGLIRVSVSRCPQAHAIFFFCQIALMLLWVCLFSTCTISHVDCIADM